jgi:hypothetical protein
MYKIYIIVYRMTQSAAPSAPAIGGAMIMGPLQVSFSWQPPTNDGGLPITTYRFTLTPEGGVATEHTIEAPNTYYQATGLVEGIALQATVKASNDNGVTYGPEFIFSPITPIVAPPAAPASASAAPVSPGLAEIVWTAAPVEPQGTAYYLVMSESSNPSDPTVGLATKDLMDTSCQLAELNPTSEYTFTVCIVNAAGRSPTVATNIIRFQE